ncbi:hypothetical protein D3C72_2095040 [compost metagenome]
MLTEYSMISPWLLTSQVCASVMISGSIECPVGIEDLWRINLTPERDNLGRIWCLFSAIKSCHKKQGRPRPPASHPPVWSSFAAIGCASIATEALTW